MREIKFRVWDKKAKYMFELDDHDYFINNNGLYERRTIGDQGDYYSNVSDKYILMQSIGLKDFNGREIFEGDIFLSLKSKGIIKYREAKFVVDWIKRPNALTEEIAPHVEEGEVIGNIYEDTELLEQE